jgi:hypothetical protein
MPSIEAVIGPIVVPHGIVFFDEKCCSDWPLA